MKKKNRKSLKEINIEMNKINKRKPVKSQIKELSKILKKLNKKK